jgi:hypothetical protein
MTTQTTTNNPLQDTFPEIPNGLTAWLIGAGGSNIHNDDVVLILCSDSNYYEYGFTIDSGGYPTFVFNRTRTQQKAHSTGSWHWGWLGIDTAVNTEEVNTGSLYTKGGSMYLWSGGPITGRITHPVKVISGIQDIPNSARLPTVEPGNHLRDYPIT